MIRSAFHNAITYFELRRQDVLLAVLLLMIALFLSLVGLKWSLPSQVRNQYYPQDVAWYEISKTEGRLYMISPYEPYHPDEGFLLDAMSNMDPANLDFNPHFFNYPTLSIYLTGAVLKMGEVLGYVSAVNSKEFYIENPDQIARVYTLGRLLVAIMSALGVVALYFTVKLMYGRPTGFLSALILAVTPLWVRNSHFMLVNVPSTTWMIGCALFAVIAIKRDSHFSLVVSALLAGLAASTRYLAGAAFILTAYAFVQQKQKSWRLAILLLGLVAFAFLLGTPYMLVSPDEFLRDMFFEGGTKLGIIKPAHLLSLLAVSQSTVLLIIALIGLGVVALRIRSWQSQMLMLWLLAGMAQRLISDADLARYLIAALPPLAIAAGVAINKVRELIAKSNLRQSEILGWAFSLLLLAPAIGYSLNIVWIMQGADVRNNVAAWLQENMPEGKQIGILTHMYYDMPPINAETYEIVDIAGMDHEDMPDVVVLTSENEIYLSQGLPPSYSSLTFSQRPLRAWAWPIRKQPHDLGYTFLDVTIYETPDRDAISEEK